MNLIALEIFSAIKPTITANHNVKNLITMARTTATEISIPCKENNPVRLPSVTPTPPGIKDTLPRIIEVA